MAAYTFPRPAYRASTALPALLPDDAGQQRPRVRSVAFGVIQALLAALLVVPFTVLAVGRAHAAPLDQTPFLTWNMQGETSQGRSVWTDYLPRILTGARSEVVMLQEAGPDVPNSAEILPNPPGTENNQLVTYARWRTSQRSSDWYIVFLQTHDRLRPGGRVNTIVMSRTPVDAAMVVDNPHGGAYGRPAIGIRLGEDWYFSFHALSGGGGDAIGMLARIGEAVEGDDPRRNWTVGADFNTRPTTLVGRMYQDVIATPDGRTPRILASGRPTCPLTSKLDCLPVKLDRSCGGELLLAPVGPLCSAGA
ncbi:endonuclease/exonuclease/phosphatase family protein [Streptomyces sp. NPDC051452]|uniref:endonuclease/exonuclease/phosphatase family protein n=1 Tax=Streptomyces sp. NPDC051452 TaxID=3365654 RepID=UPI0037A8DBE6